MGLWNNVGHIHQVYYTSWITKNHLKNQSNKVIYFFGKGIKALQKYRYRSKTNVNIWLVHKVKRDVSIYQFSLPCEYKRVKHKIKKMFKQVWHISN